MTFYHLIKCLILDSRLLLLLSGHTQIFIWRNGAVNGHIYFLVIALIYQVSCGVTCLLFFFCVLYSLVHATSDIFKVKIYLFKKNRVACPKSIRSRIWYDFFSVIRPSHIIFKLIDYYRISWFFIIDYV